MIWLVLFRHSSLYVRENAKNNRPVISFVLSFIPVLILLGCTMSTENVTEVAEQPDLTHTVASLTITPTLTSVSSTVVPLKSPTNTPTTETDLVFVCPNPPQQFNIQEHLDIIDIRQLSFINDETIIFDGWATRPKPEETDEADSTQSVDLFAPNKSARVWHKAGQLNLTTGAVVSRTLDFTPLINQPCDEKCVLDILSQSPNNEWQLVQISDGQNNQDGVWLVDQEEKIQLLPYVPRSSNWQWSTDSSLLWYVHDLEEVGTGAIIVLLNDLEAIVNVGSYGTDNPLNPTSYLTAFSPTNKTILSTVSWAGIESTPDVIYLSDLTQNPVKTVATRAVPGVRTVVWDETTQMYLLVVIKEDGLEIQDVDGVVLTKVPLDVFETLFPALADNYIDLSAVLPDKGYTLSSSREYLAIGYGSIEGIMVFDCQGSLSYED